MTDASRVATLHRRDVVAHLLADRPENLVAVAGLGSPAWDLAAAGANDLDFSFIGAMGQAGPFALGVALARPDCRVVLLTGDGELLMGVGSLATIATQAPPNLAIVVLDNEVYGETGGQPTATAGGADLAEVARGFGLTDAATITAPSELSELHRRVRSAAGPTFSVVKVVHEPLALTLPSTLDGATALNRFRDAIARLGPPS